MPRARRSRRGRCRRRLGRARCRRVPRRLRSRSRRAGDGAAASDGSDCGSPIRRRGRCSRPRASRPTFVWKDETGHVDRWDVVVRDDTGAEVLTRVGRRAALATFGGELDADQAAQRGARCRGDRRRRRPHEARDRPVVGARAHPHVEGPGRRLAVLSRGSAAVSDGRAGSVPHPLALRHHRLGVRPADRAAEPARVRELSLVRGQRQRARARRRLRQRQGRLRHHAGVEAHGDGRREDHHVVGLQARGRRAHLRLAVARVADGTLRDQHGQGPVRVRRHARTS